MAMTTPMSAFFKIVGEYAGSKPKDWNSVKLFFRDKLPTLPLQERKKILEELMAAHGEEEDLPPVKFPSRAATPRASQTALKRIQTYKAVKKKHTQLETPKLNGRRYKGTGRRKSATARVYIHSGTGQFVVNNRQLEEYFPRETTRIIARQPLINAGMVDQVNVLVRVSGSGTTGQAGAIRLGVARALLDYDYSLRKQLRSAGFLTSDARRVERKKVGRHKARKRPQYSKR